MNSVTWAIQTNLMNDNAMRTVWQAALDAGAKVQEIVVLPFTDDFHNEVPEMEGIVIPYGSTSFTKISKRKGWTGNCYIDETFRANVWNDNRNDMLNADAVIMKVKETAEYFKDTDEEDYWFIRPVKDLKEFTGTVSQVGDIKSWMSSPKSGNFSFGEDTEILLAPLKTLYSESRFFVVDRKVVSGSYYRMGGRMLTKRITEQEVIDYAQEKANGWLPHECCVMDLADTDDGIKVIEFNTINGSGFYDHDIPEIVKAMTEWGRNLT
jgi:ATP-grasp domain, R2K clade family 3